MKMKYKAMRVMINFVLICVCVCVCVGGGERFVRQEACLVRFYSMLITCVHQLSDLSQDLLPRSFASV
jgi:hypothetical protein